MITNDIKGVIPDYMEISQQINHLLERYGCTAKELAEASELSVSAISRYRSGARHPSEQQLQKLAKGFAVIAQEHGETFDDRELVHPVREKNTDMDMFIKKFNILVSTLDINMNDFARFSNYDPSFISRIRSKQRMIPDSRSFAETIGEFLNTKYRTPHYDSMVGALISRPVITDDRNAYISSVRDWFLSPQPPDDNKQNHVTETDLQNYFARIGFVPSDTTPPAFDTVKDYIGKKKVCCGELDFLRHVLAEDNVRELYLFNEMPHFIFRHEELANEWLYLMSRIIQKGVCVTIIHNIERPMEDIVIGIEKMFPLYLTGKLKPYYLPSPHSNIYYHICGCTENMVMYGDGMYGSEAHVRLHLDRTEEAKKYYRREIRVLLEKSRPLMNIYQKEEALTFRQFIRADIYTEGNRQSILSSFPLYTLSKELLLSILSRQNVSPEELHKILAAYEEVQRNGNAILKKNPLHDNISVLSREEFDQQPPLLPLSYAFLDRDFYYTYDEYLLHQQQTLALAQNCSNYTVTLNRHSALKTFDILVHQNKWITISRSSAPATHFVVRHPNIRRAIENIADFISQRSQNAP